MIAPFLSTRVDSENKVANWISETSPWASKMVDLIAGFLSGRTGSGLSAFQGGRNWCLTQEPPADSPKWTVCVSESCFTALFSWIWSVTLENNYEENSSLQLQVGRETVYCGLWYVHPGSLFAFVYIYFMNLHLARWFTCVISPILSNWIKNRKAENIFLLHK